MRHEYGVRELITIVEKRVKLRPIGKAWVGLCPFHNERHPSFQVFAGSDGKGCYKCHACGEGGDAIGWLLRMEGKTIAEVLAEREDPEITAARAGARRWETRRQAVLRRYHDANPECVVPDRHLDTTKPYNWRPGDV